MKIEIESSGALRDYYLKDIQDQQIKFTLGEELQVESGWYQLNVHYTGEKINIDKIYLNDVDIKELIYTGHYIDGQGNIHQPGTALWDDGGCFKIWLHSNAGIFQERIRRCIRNGDFGKDLSEKYQFTCDKPLTIDQSFPVQVKSFFSTGQGPHWWHRNNYTLPYFETKVPDVSKEQVMEECGKICVHTRETKGYKIYSTNPNCNFDLPFLELDENVYPALTKLLAEIGMQKAMSIGFHSLGPGKYIDVHIDDEASHRKAYQYLKGCTVFYWVLTDPKDVHYKFGQAGLLPMDKPLFINPFGHVHSVINAGESTRWVVTIAGKYHAEKNMHK